MCSCARLLHGKITRRLRPRSPQLMHGRSLLAASTTALAIICTYVPALGAGCPVELTSIVFNGQAASHSFVRYYLRLSGAAGTISTIRIALKTSNGRLASTTWQDATLKLVPNGKE